MGDEGFRPPPEHAEKPDHWLEPTALLPLAGRRRLLG
jgi:hypothetical protein